MIFKKILISLLILFFSFCSSIYTKERKETYNMKIELLENNLYLVTINFLVRPKVDVGSGLVLLTIITCDILEFGEKKDYTFMMINPIEGKFKRDEEKNISRLNVYFSETENKIEFINSLKKKGLQISEVYETKEYLKQCTEYLETRKR